VARSEGFEPPTLGIEIRCSIQLSSMRTGSLGRYHAGIDCECRPSDGFEYSGLSA
jgi:hypothetical protein